MVRGAKAAMTAPARTPTFEQRELNRTPVSTIALIGANGQLGTDLRGEFEPHRRELIPLTREELDIRDGDAVARELDRLRPDIIVNTAAFLNVEECEVHPEQAFLVNSKAVQRLAAEADRIGACLVHISTDYVFDGAARAPYPEDAPT